MRGESITGDWEEYDAYARFIGRWSSPVAIRFLDWLVSPDGLRWASAPHCVLQSATLGPAGEVGIVAGSEILKEARVRRGPAKSSSRERA